VSVRLSIIVRVCVCCVWFGFKIKPVPHELHTVWALRCIWRLLSVNWILTRHLLIHFWHVNAIRLHNVDLCNRKTVDRRRRRRMLTCHSIIVVTEALIIIYPTSPHITATNNNQLAKRNPRSTAYSGIHSGKRMSETGDLYLSVIYSFTQSILKFTNCRIIKTFILTFNGV